jgi:DNA (cytosine-5)-methyltransferase 1
MGLIVDLFAGGGGASTGMEMAFGRSPDIAVNHDPEAIAMHRANHPDTLHLCANVLKVLPLDATKGQPVDWLHASPDCTHFSKAKGGKPRAQFIRDLAWVVVRWAEDTRPTVISLENVEEFQTWGPLDRFSQPVKSQAGDTFRAWVRRLRRLGYKVSWRALKACDYGAPTTRKRLFVVARRDGKAPIWPKPTHGDPQSKAVLSGKLLPWRTAAECIDWTIPTTSIFERKKPLADNTMRRIAEGVRRYVLQSPAPFLVAYYGAKGPKDFRGSSLENPLRTQTTENRFGLVAPYLQHMQHSKAKNGTMPAAEPMRTITAYPKGGCFSVISPMLSRQFGKSIGQGVETPHPTITRSNHDMLLAAGLCKHYGTTTGQSADVPLSTVAGKNKHSLSLLSASLIKYYSGGGQGEGQHAEISDPMHTLTCKARMGLSTVHIQQYNGASEAQPITDPLPTVSTRDRFGLASVELGYGGHYEEVRDFLRLWKVIGPDEEAEVIIDGELYRIVDISLRMLKARELYRAQGFDDNYIIAPLYRDKPLTITAQVRMCGNSVPPQFLLSLAQANGPDTWAERRPVREAPCRRNYTLPLLNAENRKNTVSKNFNDAESFGFYRLSSG